ncbi:2948_t:CDS:2 [Funneliformis caledonium]|uniref:2948_t:CDS:1 n=1 Tax=Funneliformis caledonium TaxID=1117310 RepID=A0A9N9DSZ0_9GLOM|nr:2948_t:CDS:2 [Funneliformis caledonium]
MLHEEIKASKMKQILRLFIVLAFIVVMVTPMAVNKRQLPECPTDDNTTAPPNMSDNDAVPTSNDDTCYKPKPANA